VIVGRESLKNRKFLVGRQLKQHLWTNFPQGYLELPARIGLVSHFSTHTWQNQNIYLHFNLKSVSGSSEKKYGQYLEVSGYRLRA
jgi:hypothetical protein